MKVTVVGKEHASGKSRKTGKEFDSNIVHVTNKKNGTDGLTVDSIWLDPAAYPLRSIEVGAEYNAAAQDITELLPQVSG